MKTVNPLTCQRIKYFISMLHLLLLLLTHALQFHEEFISCSLENDLITSNLKITGFLPYRNLYFRNSFWNVHSWYNLFIIQLNAFLYEDFGSNYPFENNVSECIKTCEVHNLLESMYTFSTDARFSYQASCEFYMIISRKLGALTPRMEQKCCFGMWTLILNWYRYRVATG